MHWSRKPGDLEDLRCHLVAMPHHDDITPLTLPEISHRLRDLQESSDEHSDAIHAIGAELAARKEILNNMASSIEAIRGDIRWMTKRVMAAVVGAILALVLKESLKELGPSLLGTAASSTPSRAVP